MAPTMIKFEPSSNSTLTLVQSIFVAPLRFSTERELNSVQLWTVVWALVKFW